MNPDKVQRAGTAREGMRRPSARSRAAAAGALAPILLAMAPGTAAAQQPERPAHVAMISVDGLRPAEYLRPDACGAPLPTLSAMMREGVYAEGMTGVLPAVTYPSHATLVTGTYPTTHGILTNGRPRDGAEWHYDRSDIRGATLWDAARAAGKTVGIVTWPSSHGATVDWLIPEDLSSTPDVTERVRAGSTPGLFASLETAAGGAVRMLPFNHADAGEPLDRMTASFAAELVRRHRPALLLLHFLDLDHREHQTGAGSGASCASLRRIDGYLGELREAYRAAGVLERTAFVVVSDHGFLPVHTQVNVAALARLAGIDMAALTMRPGSGSAGFYLKDPSDAALAARIERELRPLVESRLGGIVRWRTSAQAAELGGFPGAAFVLCAAAGYSIANHGPDRPLTARVGEGTRGAHGHCPDEPGIEASFLASGAGIRPLGRIPRVRMLDVAPTVAELLGIRLPEAEGVAIAGVVR